MAAAIFLVFLILALIAPIVLFYFVRAEHDNRETMDRQAAERTARRDSTDPDRPDNEF